MSKRSPVFKKYINSVFKSLFLYNQKRKLKHIYFMIEKNQFSFAYFRQQFKCSGLPLGDLVSTVGKYFLHAPYQPEALESGRKEKLIINFDKFDCLTFVETVMALAKCVTAGNISKFGFQSTLQFIRYRNGTIDSYSSRLHYFSDWLMDNEKKGILRDISRKLGSVSKRKNINYMTRHRTSYHAFRNEDEFQKMVLIEKKISRRLFKGIDKNEACGVLDMIKHGDIIAFISTEEGLDIAHAGFAVRKGRNLYLLHASSKEGSVVISQKTLSAYLKQNKKFSGIVAARLL